MALSLTCGCELDVERRLWRLFGLVPESRRRSRFVTVLRDRGTIDLSPAAVGKPASLRSAAFPTAGPITCSLLEESNLQGHEGHKELKGERPAGSHWPPILSCLPHESGSVRAVDPVATLSRSQGAPDISVN